MTNNTPDYEDNLYCNSQNTKNEQQKDLCITDDTLTEQWRKGELPEGEEYWVILTDEWYLRKPVEPVRAFYSCDCEFEGYYDDDIKEVLAPVPSYEEWQASEKYNKHLEEVIKIYERKDKQATETSIAYNELLEENAILKELLKDCRLAVFDYPPFDLASEKIRLTNKIEEVLR